MIEEEKNQLNFGSSLNLDEFIKPEYLITSMQEVKVPTKTQFKIPAHKREVTCVCFNPLGDAIATGGGDALIKIWNVNTGKEDGTSLRGFSKPITDIAISMDNELLAASSTEHKTLIFSLKTKRTS